jgi:hypothetical protein
VNGVPVNAVIVPKTGAAEKDQLAFADPPTAGAPIRVSYFWVSGGEEKNVGNDTVFKSAVDYVVTKGTANGVEPTLPAGNVKLAIISGIQGSTTSITTGMISDRRELLYGPGFGNAPIATPSGSLKSFFENYGFLRNGYFHILDLLATRTLLVRRTVNATDKEPLMSWARPGSTDGVTFIDRRAHLHQNYKAFREDWDIISVGGTEASRWTLSGTGSPAASRPALTGGVAQLVTSAGGSDTAFLNGKIVFDYTAATSAPGVSAAENHISMKWVVAPLSLATVRYAIGIGNATLSVGFEYSSAGLGTVPAANWATNIVTAGPTNNYGNTGVVATTDLTLFEIVQRAAGTWDFYINGVNVGTISLTPTTQTGTPMWGVGNLTTAARTLYCKLATCNTGRLFV